MEGVPEGQEAQVGAIALETPSALALRPDPSLWRRLNRLLRHGPSSSSLRCRTILLFVCSTAVLLGVAVLIPIWTMFYVASSTVDAACDAGAAAGAINMNTPVGEVTKSIQGGILEGSKWVSSKLGDLGFPPTDITFPKLSDYPIDYAKACDVADGVNFWSLTMCVGRLRTRSSLPACSMRGPPSACSITSRDAGSSASSFTSLPL